MQVVEAVRVDEPPAGQDRQGPGPRCSLPCRGGWPVGRTQRQAARPVPAQQALPRGTLLGPLGDGSEKPPPPVSLAPYHCGGAEGRGSLLLSKTWQLPGGRVAPEAPGTCCPGGQGLHMTPVWSAEGQGGATEGAGFTRGHTPGPASVFQMCSQAWMTLILSCAAVCQTERVPY